MNPFKRQCIVLDDEETPKDMFPALPFKQRLHQRLQAVDSKRRKCAVDVKDDIAEFFALYGDKLLNCIETLYARNDRLLIYNASLLNLFPGDLSPDIYQWMKETYGLSIQRTECCLRIFLDDKVDDSIKVSDPKESQED